MNTHSSPPGYTVSLVAFVAFGLLTAALLPLCYVPWTFGLDPTEMDSGVFLYLLADKSGATPAKCALLAYACAQFFCLRERLRRREALLRSVTETISGGRTVDLLNRQEQLLAPLPAHDPVAVFVRGVIERVSNSAERDPHATIELLERRLGRENRLRPLVMVLIVLGLLGTLLGLYVGFVIYARVSDASELQHMLNLCVKVVATASISSIVGIGFAELIVKPMSLRVDRHTQIVLDHALAVENSLTLRA